MKKYTHEEKKSIVSELYIANSLGTTKKDFAASKGIHPDTLRTWEKKYGQSIDEEQTTTVVETPVDPDESTLKKLEEAFENDAPIDDDLLGEVTEMLDDDNIDEVCKPVDDALKELDKELNDIDDQITELENQTGVAAVIRGEFIVIARNDDTGEEIYLKNWTRRQFVETEEKAFVFKKLSTCKKYVDLVVEHFRSNEHIIVSYFVNK